MKVIKVKYHKENPELLGFIGGYNKSCAVDLYTAEEIKIKAGQFAKINLGVSIEIPEGYKADMKPRSSTFEKFGLVQTNSVGLIDESYCGNDDIWTLPVFRPITALDVVKMFADYTANLFLPHSEKDPTPMIVSNLNKVKNQLELMEMIKGMVMPSLSEVVIPAGTRLCQIEILPRMKEMEFKKVENLEGPNRSGFGSTGTGKTEDVK